MVSGLHGYLVIDKPAGWTSHDVVGRVRRLLGERHIGHAGTLDPAATGVLPLAVGAATKTLEFLENATKTYLAEITFGVETDSYDADGRVTAVTGSVKLDSAPVQRALADFLGPRMQVPPMHSAIRIGGKRLYEAARRGEEVDRPARPVTFFHLELVAWDAPVATVLVDCSKGTYVRSLANDLGRKLAVGAHLSGLIRLRSGPFSLCEAWTLGELTEKLETGEWPSVSLHPDVPLMDTPAIVLGREAAERWRRGQAVPGSESSGSVEVDVAIGRAYDAAGDWLGVGRRDPNSSDWHPVKVLAAPSDAAATTAEGRVERGFR